jgi:hypothetical protein
MLLSVANIQLFGMQRKVAGLNPDVNYAFLWRTARRNTFAAKILEQ